jgi:hypothetical protein
VMRGFSRSLGRFFSRLANLAEGGNVERG